MRARLPWLGLLLPACASAPPAPPTLEPPPHAATAATATPTSPVLSAAPPGSASAAAPEPSAPPAPASSPPLEVTFEAPYSVRGHAALATEMLTLERDEELFQWALGGSADPQHPAHRPGYHPATRVVVDIELRSRAPKGTSKQILRVARSHGYWPLRSCFEAAERLLPKPERSARIRLTLGAQGKVLGSRSLLATPEREYGRCVLERVRSLDFRPGFGRKLDVDIDVKQWPGHAPVPPRAPPDATQPRLTGEAAVALVNLRPALVACYEAGLREDPGLWGRLAFQLDVDENGSPKAATQVETRFPNARVVECAESALRSTWLVGMGPGELRLGLRLRQMPPTPPVPVPAPGAPPSPVGAPPTLPPVPPAPSPPTPAH